MGLEHFELVSFPPLPGSSSLRYVIKREANNGREISVEENPLVLVVAVFFANIRSAENSRLTNISLRVLSPSHALRAVRLQLCPLRSTIFGVFVMLLRLFFVVCAESEHSGLADWTAIECLFFTSNNRPRWTSRTPRRDSNSNDVALFAISPENINTISIFPLPPFVHYDGSIF